MDAATEVPRIGGFVPGYQVPVINERAVRVAAGILFLAGGTALVLAVVEQSVRPLQPFGMFFVIDMFARVLAGDRWSPTLALGRLIVRRQRPEWVGAAQKEYAWWLGLGLALTSCLTMGLFAVPLWVTLVLCGSCLTLLFLEAAFGICVGCALQARFGRRPPMYCPGGSCEVDRSGSPGSSAPL
ncbi:MAG: DUF4395 domain-containing protein [Actinobacteria bacterium]|nr:DUF4395 domain-containing protein [Actinomycetota bacterium]